MGKYAARNWLLRLFGGKMDELKEWKTPFLANRTRLAVRCSGPNPACKCWLTSCPSDPSCFEHVCMTKLCACWVETGLIPVLLSPFHNSITTAPGNVTLVDWETWIVVWGLPGVGNMLKSGPVPLACTDVFCAYLRGSSVDLLSRQLNTNSSGELLPPVPVCVGSGWACMFKDVGLEGLFGLVQQGSCSYPFFCHEGTDTNTCQSHKDVHRLQVE